MNLLDEIQATWQIEDKKKRAWELASFDTILETDSSLSKEEVETVVYFLLDKSFEEPDEILQRTMFDLINKAVIYQKVGPYINWDILISHLSSLSIDSLVYALDILGTSKKEKYIPILERYVHHFNRDIQHTAFEAINTIKSS